MELYYSQGENMNKREMVCLSKEHRANVEKMFVEQMKEVGFEVVKNTMPGFVCYRPDGAIVFVAVKMSRKHKLSHKQKKFLNALRKTARGTKIYCYKWSPDNNWIRKQHNEKYIDNY